MKRKLGIKLLSLTVLVLIVSSLFTACSSESAAEKELIDKKWTLTSYGDPSNPADVIADTTTTIEFVSKDSKITGRSGCNTYFGGYTIKGDTLTIGDGIAVTEMYCGEPEGIMDQEQTYLTILGTAESFEISGGQLTITCDNQVLIYK